MMAHGGPIRAAITLVLIAASASLPACDARANWRSEVFDPQSDYYAAIRNDFQADIIEDVQAAAVNDPHHIEIISEFAREADIDELEALSLALAGMATANPSAASDYSPLLKMAYERFLEFEREELRAGHVRTGATWFLVAGRLPPSGETIGVMQSELTHPRRSTFAAKYIGGWTYGTPEHEPLVRALLTDAVTNPETHPTGAAEAAIQLARHDWWTPQRSLAWIDDLLETTLDDHAARWIRTKRDGFVRLFEAELAGGP